MDKFFIKSSGSPSKGPAPKRPIEEVKVEKKEEGIEGVTSIVKADLKPDLPHGVKKEERVKEEEEPGKRAKLEMKTAT